MKTFFHKNEKFFADDDDDCKDGLLAGEERRVRKRANLDHLSSEEKLMRRKLKNRVAAQVLHYINTRSSLN
jgi:hypothetical protein